MNGNFSAHVGARITEFMARMRQVQNTIRTTANDVRVDVGADVSEFNRRMAEIRARIASLVRERVIVRIEARIEDFQNKINRIATNIRAFGELMQHTLAGSMMAVFPAIIPLIANVGVAIANLGPMIGTVAGSTFALAGAFAAAGAGAVAFAAVAIPTIKKLFDENAKLNAEQKKAKASFDAFKNTYNGLVKATEAPVLSAFTNAMNISNQLLKTLEPLFLSSARAVDNLMTSLSKSISTPPVQAFLEYLNTTGGPMLETFGRSFGNVFQGIGSMLVAFAPLSASTAKGFEDMTARFAEWSNGLSSSAKFQSFMDYVSTNMPKIRAIFRDATAGAVYFFSAFGGSASGMMDGLVDMMARFKEWSSTLSQNQGFQTFVSYVQQTAPSVISLIGNLTKFLVNLGIGMAPLGAVILVLVNKFLEFTNSAMEGNRSIGLIIAGLISFGGILLAVVPNLIAFGTLFKGLGPLIVKSLGSAFKLITPLFTNFSGVVARVVALLPKVGAALGLITSPAALIVAAIAGLIAVFVGLYNTNETFRAQVQTVWSAIQTAISVAVTAVKDLVMSVWSQITTFWDANQESIKSTASKVWDVIGKVVTSVMTAIGAIMQFVWPVVKALIVSTWNAIQNVIQGATKVILGIVKTFSSLFQGDWRGVWNGIKQILSGAVQAIWGVVNLYFVGKLLGPLKAFGGTAKTLMQTAWAAIKGIFTKTLNTIKTFVSTIFNSIKSSISNIMNGIKTTISTIWNAIKSTITTILNGIKTTIMTIWSAYRTIVTNTLNAIKTIVTSIWNAIKTVITTVLNGIKTVITAIWNGIKSFITSILNGIKSIITSTWNAIKNVVSTTMNGVKTVIVDGWNGAKSFLSNINLVSIGKDIIQGLINGIGSMMGSVKNKVTELANSIPEWAKKILGIHSPSRVMIAIAKWIPIGVAKGIDAVSNVVAKATNRMTQKAIPDFSQTVKTTETMTKNIDKIVKDSAKSSNAEVAKIQADFNKKRAELERNATDQIAVIKASASKKTQENTKAQQQRISNILADAAAGREKLAKQEAEAIAKVSNKSQTSMLSSLEQFVSNKESLEQWSTKQQAEYWKYATSLFKANTDERIKAQNYYNKAMVDLTKEQFDAEKDYIERKKQYNQMSLTQELAAYDKYLKQYKAGSEERIHYEDKVAETKKAIHEKLMSLNEEYVTKIAEAQQEEIDGIKELEKSYEDAVNTRTNSLYSTVSIFDEIEEKAAASGEKLISNLREQNEAFRFWASNIQDLAAKGIDEGLLAELQAMGPSAASEIAALNSISTSQLIEYVSLWKEKSSLARKQAEMEHVGLKNETEKQIKAIQTKTEAQLKQYEKEWASKIKEVRTGTEKQFNAMTASMPQVGRDVIKGMQRGLSDMSPQLFSQAQSIADNIKRTIESALDIHSPSRWGKKMIGHNLVKGIIIGLADMKQDAIKAADRVAEWIQPHVEVSDIINDISGAIDAIQTEIEHKVKVNVEIEGQSGNNQRGGGVHQAVHLHSPKHLSPSENARQLKRVAQQLIY